MVTGSLSMVLTDHPSKGPLLCQVCPYKRSLVGLLFVKVRLILEHLSGLFFPSELFFALSLAKSVPSWKLPANIENLKPAEFNR